MFREIHVVRSANLVAVNPPYPDFVPELISSTLTFEIHDRKFGPRSGKTIRSVQCSKQVDGGQIQFLMGYWPRVFRALRGRGLAVSFREPRLSPAKARVYRPDYEAFRRSIRIWEDMKGRPFKWRHGQDVVLSKMARRPYGCYDIPTGWGKTTTVFLLAALFPLARIHVVVRPTGVLLDMHRDLASVFPSVGLVKASVRQLDARIVLFSAASLHHADGKADFLIGDEVHELSLPKVLANLVRYGGARTIGLSASIGMREDRQDFRAEGVFGPVVHRISYTEAVRRGEVTPIAVLWRKVPPPRFPPPPRKPHVDRVVHTNRWGVWRNSKRNKMIVSDAILLLRRGLQTLVSVQSIEHGLRLRKAGLRVPFVFGVQSGSGKAFQRKARRFLKEGLIESVEELVMTPARFEKLRRDFESGKLRGAVATGVWNTGVDFRRLGALIRADGLGSDIRSVQVPGRLSRLWGGKRYGILIDYQDGFYPGIEDLGGRARKKSRQYARIGWVQRVVSRRLLGRIVGEEKD